MVHLCQVRVRLKLRTSSNIPGLLGIAVTDGGTVLESLTSLTNTLMEIGLCHLLDRICFESMTTLGVECYFKGMRADHDMPTVANYAYRTARCVKDSTYAVHLSVEFLIFYWAQFILSRENCQR